ncbi:hypothetical protein SAMN04488096_1052 [Mesonia phycicola]|uniref:Uncharacterized protein n=1 Tax=Mesonia phycicola TaxID=579105 RepID=A0A1M6EB93_9FLAO|nr:DUF6686 family protein [Mesonia phycicola]SHI82766.1 hypothetical protein SAMN04488096_1052 [Mesonia phycicola]
MDDIRIIFRNEFGIAFYWKSKKDKIQIVFRDTGFILNLEEIKSFQKNVLNVQAEKCCSKCNYTRSCKNLLLKTPSSKIDLAVSLDELGEINELLGATIFKLEMKNYVNNSFN